MRQSAVVNSDLPTCELVPRTMMARAWLIPTTVFGYGREEGLVLPCSRPFRTGLTFIAKARINPGIQFDQPAKEPNQIRKPIEISQDLRLHLLTAFRQPHRMPLRSPADRPG